MLKSLKKPAMLGVIGLTAIAGLTGCDDDQSPSNPKNFPSQEQMESRGSTWYGLIINNAVNKGQLPRGSKANGCRWNGRTAEWPQRVNWQGNQWTLDVDCSYFRQGSGSPGNGSTGTDKGMVVRADWTKDWITGSQFQ